MLLCAFSSRLDTVGPLYHDDRSALVNTFADDFVDAEPSRFQQMLDAQAAHGGSVITCVKRDNDADYRRYGYVSGSEVSPGLIDVDKVVEKPGSREQAPSNLASVSGYVFDPVILEYLQKQLESHDPKQGEFM